MNKKSSEYLEKYAILFLGVLITLLVLAQLALPR